jgi:hypothetical protein
LKNNECLESWNDCCIPKATAKNFHAEAIGAPHRQGLNISAKTSHNRGLNMTQLNGSSSMKLVEGSCLEGDSSGILY